MDDFYHDLWTIFVAIYGRFLSRLVGDFYRDEWMIFIAIFGRRQFMVKYMAMEVLRGVLHHGKRNKEKEEGKKEGISIS